MVKTYKSPYVSFGIKYVPTEEGFNGRAIS